MKKILSFVLLLVFVLSFCSCTAPENSEQPKQKSSKDFIAFEDEQTGLYGYKDKDGNIVIDCQFDRAGPFHNDRALVWKNKRGGYIDGSGNIVVDYRYKEAGDFSNGRAVVREEEKFGYIDTNGNAITEFIYDNATAFNTNGTATVILDGKTMLIDKSGKEVSDSQTNE